MSHTLTGRRLFSSTKPTMPCSFLSGSIPNLLDKLATANLLYTLLCPTTLRLSRPKRESRNQLTLPGFYGTCCTSVFPTVNEWPHRTPTRHAPVTSISVFFLDVCGSTTFGYPLLIFGEDPEVLTLVKPDDLAVIHPYPNTITAPGETFVHPPSSFGTYSIDDLF